MTDHTLNVNFKVKTNTMAKKKTEGLSVTGEVTDDSDGVAISHPEDLRIDEDVINAMVAAGVDAGHDACAMSSLAPVIFAMLKAYHG